MNNQNFLIVMLGVVTIGTVIGTTAAQYLYRFLVRLERHRVDKHLARQSKPEHKPAKLELEVAVTGLEMFEADLQQATEMIERVAEKATGLQAAVDGAIKGGNEE